MVSVPAGDFSLNGVATHVQAFEIDRSEATVTDWQSCVSAGVCSADVAAVNVKAAQAWSVLCNWPRRIERAEHPINCVSQQQAQEYCRWNAKRLPTDAEWYYAAYVLGGDREYPWGKGAPESSSANLCGSECATMLRASGLVKGKQPLSGSFSDAYADTGPVTAFATDETAAGIRGLGGNVMEWTSTRIGGKVSVRGGSWLSSKLQDLERSATFELNATERRVNVGFRCVR